MYTCPYFIGFMQSPLSLCIKTLPYSSPLHYYFQVVCNTMLKRSICLSTRESTKDYSAKSMSSWFLEKRKWLPCDFPLNVEFRNNCPVTWRCTDPNVVLSMANESWTECFSSGQDRPHICVTFENG